MSKVVYVSIGNSDDKLTQHEWSQFCLGVDDAIRDYAERVHGEWYSLPVSIYQNACWAFEIERDELTLWEELRVLAGTFKQDSIAWADCPKTDFIMSVEELSDA